MGRSKKQKKDCVELEARVRKTKIEFRASKKVNSRHPQSVPYVVQSILWNYFLTLLQDESADVRFTVRQDELEMIPPLVKRAVEDLKKRMEGLKIKEIFYGGEK
jgi:hypothetical protein